MESKRFVDEFGQRPSKFTTYGTRNEVPLVSFGSAQQRYDRPLGFHQNIPRKQYKNATLLRRSDDRVVTVVGQRKYTTRYSYPRGGVLPKQISFRHASNALLETVLIFALNTVKRTRERGGAH